MNETKVRPGCMKDPLRRSICLKVGCMFRADCLSAGVDRRGPVIRDFVPGKKMEGGVVLR